MLVYLCNRALHRGIIMRQCICVDMELDMSVVPQYIHCPV